MSELKKRSASCSLILLVVALMMAGTSVCAEELKIDGDLKVTGAVHAAAFQGDGSQLTGVDAAPPVTNNTTEAFLKSISFGSGNKITGLAVGTGAFVHGLNNTVSGIHAHAGGKSTRAVGAFSHAEGVGAVASNNYSHAEGAVTLAAGLGSHAEGLFSKALGNFSHSEGRSTTASGEASHSEGCFTEASGAYSHAAGWSAKAMHDRTFVWSDGTDISSTTNNQVTFYAANGFRFLGGEVTVNGTNIMHAVTSVDPIPPVTNTTTKVFDQDVTVNGAINVIGSLKLGGQDAATEAYVDSLLENMVVKPARGNLSMGAFTSEYQ